MPDQALRYFLTWHGFTFLQEKTRTSVVGRLRASVLIPINWEPLPGRDG